MGFAGISVAKLLLLLLIVIVLFGTKRLRTVGRDLGAGLASFKQGLREGEETPRQESSEQSKIEQHTNQ